MLQGNKQLEILRRTTISYFHVKPNKKECALAHSRGFKEAGDGNRTRLLSLGS